MRRWRRTASVWEERLPVATDEEAGPRLLFADGTQSTYLADMSGDGLSDLVRIRNGSVAVLAEPRLRTLRSEGRDGRRSAVRGHGRVQPGADSAGRRRRLRLHGHHLPRRRRGGRLRQRVGQSLECGSAHRVAPARRRPRLRRRDRLARHRHRVPRLVVAVARRCQLSASLRRPDGPEAASPDGCEEQPRRRDTHRLRALDDLLPEGQERRQAVDHAVAVPGSRGGAGRDARPHQRQPIREPVRIPSRLL